MYILLRVSTRWAGLITARAGRETHPGDITFSYISDVDVEVEEEDEEEEVEEEEAPRSITDADSNMLRIQ